MKVLVIYGTRPEYLKLISIIKHIPCQVMRILQHTDIPEQDQKYDYLVQLMNVCDNRLNSLGSQILLQLGSFLTNFTHVIVQGDTATAFYSALAAFQSKVKVIHLEAGLRTHDILNPYPEECYRQMISRFADIHLCPHEENRRYLADENIDGNTYVVGNTILDLVKSYNLKVKRTNKVLITFHRRENIEFLDDFVNQLKICMESYPVFEFLWFLHPNRDLQQKVKNYNLNCSYIEPCNHREFLNYVKDCHCILTDSGGIQEECAFLGKSTIVLRTHTERDQLKEPYLFLVPPPFTNLTSTFEKISNQDLAPCYVYGSGNSYQIIKIILHNYGLTDI